MHEEYIVRRVQCGCEKKLGHTTRFCGRASLANEMQMTRFNEVPPVFIQPDRRLYSSTVNIVFDGGLCSNRDDDEG
jgi:hypothetical protein